jgi:putative thiamine transport system permease protein
MNGKEAVARSHAIALPLSGILREGGWLRLLPAVTLAVFLLPVVAGLAGTLLPAFGYLPSLGAARLSLAPIRSLLEAPELPAALVATLVSGVGATFLSFLAAVGIAAGLHGTRSFAWLRRMLAPLLATPHAALAIGFAFLIAPSGWLMRLAAPLMGSGTLPPDWALPGDRFGLALAAGLWLKETPFLLFAIVAGMNQLPVARALDIARLLGYGRIAAWLKVVLPPLYRQIRLPIYAVLAFSLSVVDMAMILGPSTPPTLAALLLKWFDDPSLEELLPAAAGALLQALLVVAAILSWRLGEAVAGILARGWLEAGVRGGPGVAGRRAGATLATLLLFLVAGSVLALGVWSFTQRWPFASVLPISWTLEHWSGAGMNLGRTVATSFLLALGATAIALALSFGCLENERRHGLHPTARALWLIYLPLLVPQISFLFGTVALFDWLGIEAGAFALVWSHVLFVLPYVFLMLADPYRALDERYRRTALCLGASGSRVFFALMLPMLLRPILMAAAIGFSVSIALYLPTVFVGAGRFATLATEAVAANAGADRRLAGTYGFLQAALPLAVFTLALVLPRILYRHRRALLPAAAVA